MKDLYTFTVSFQMPNSKKKEKAEIIIKKPNNSMMENAEFYYASKFNEYLNAGFLSKAMVQKKISDLGGVLGKAEEESITNEISNIFDAQRVIEFFSSSPDSELTDDQKQQLEKAKKLLTKSQRTLIEYNSSLSAMFNQTADVKAQEKLIKWLALFCSFYKETIGDKENQFELFEGTTLKEKESFYAKILDEEYDETDSSVAKKAAIILEASKTIGKVLAIWYNGLASDQKSIKQQLDVIEKQEKEEQESLVNLQDE